MKRMMIFMLVALMLMMGIASAVIYPPMPINGKVDGINVGGLEIEITNLRTGKMDTTETTGAGEYLVDWSNTDDEGETIIKFMIGDQYKIIIPSCSESPDCVKTVTYMGESEIYSYFDLTSIILPCPVHDPCPVCPAPKTIDDFKDVICAEVNEFCKGEIEIYCFLSDTTPYDKKDCNAMNTEPETWQDIGVGLIVGLMMGLILFVGGGMKFYKNRAGNATLHHRHRGIKEYHDPNTLHNNIAYRHTRWKDNPMQCIMDVKKIEELGGLI